MKRVTLFLLAIFLFIAQADTYAQFPMKRTKFTDGTGSPTGYPSEVTTGSNQLSDDGDNTYTLSSITLNPYLGIITVGANASGYDVKFYGSTTAKYLLWDSSEDKLFVNDVDISAGGGAPTDADYLVGTANGSLSAEIVAGTSPGGSLGGTWASPTIDDLFLLNTGDTSTGDYTFAGSVTADRLFVGTVTATGTVTGSNLSGTNTGDDDVPEVGDFDAFVGGTNCTYNTTTNELNVDDAFLSNTGDSGAGNYDIQGTLTTGVNDTGYDVKFYGATAAKYLLWDESADTLFVEGDTQLGNSVTGDTIGINAAIDANNLITATFSDSATNSTNYFVKGAMTNSGDTNSSRLTYGYYLDQNLSGADSTVITTCNAYGVYIDQDDTSTLTVAPNHRNYGVYADVNWAGTNTDSITLANYGGFFSSSGNMGTTGSTSHYGGFFTTSGTADTNYGLYVTSSGATVNWAIYNAAGANYLGADNVLSYFGTGVSGNTSDASIGFDGNSLNIIANVITGTDDMEFLADAYTFQTQVNTDLVFNFSGTSNSGVMTWMEDEDYLKFGDAVTVGINATGYDVKFYGSTTAKYMLWDASEDKLFVNDVDISAGGSGDITAVGDVASSAAFNGTAGTTLTFEGDAGADILLKYDTTDDDFEFGDDITIEDATPHLRLTDTTASEDDFELYGDGGMVFLTNVTDGVELLYFDNAHNGFIGDLEVGKDYQLSFRGENSTGTITWKEDEARFNLPKLEINNAIVLPTSDGTAGQVLQTNGSGTVSFQDSNVPDFYEYTLLPESAVLDEDNPPDISIVDSGDPQPRFRIGEFDTTSDDLIYWVIHIPSDIDTTADWYLDQNWFGDDTNAGTVQWACEIAKLTVGDDSDSQTFDTANVCTATSVDTSTAKGLVQTTITIDQADTDAVSAGDTVIILFYRDVSGDTYGGDANLVNCRLRIPR